MQRTKKEIENQLGIPLEEVVPIIMHGPFTPACKIVLDDTKVEYLKEAYSLGYIKQDWEKINQRIISLLTEFMRRCAHTKINTNVIDIYSLMSIKKIVVENVLGVSTRDSGYLVGTINLSKDKIRKMINELLNKIAQKIRMQILKEEASSRITADEMQIYEEFLDSNLTFEDFVLARKQENFTVGKLQRILLDCELLGKEHPKRHQTNGFCFKEYLRSLDEHMPTYVIFQQEDIMYKILEEYSNLPILVDCKLKMYSSNSRIMTKTILEYYKLFYPKGYADLMAKKQKVVRQDMKLKEMAKREVYLKECKQLFQEKGNLLSSFSDFGGNKNAFLKATSLTEKEFDMLLECAKEYNPDLYSKIIEEMDAYFEDLMIDFMLVEELLNKLGYEIYKNPKYLQTFLYEYSKSAINPLPELINASVQIKSACYSFYVANRTLIKHVYRFYLKTHGTEYDEKFKRLLKMFDKEEYFNKKHTLNGFIIDETVVNEVLSILESNEIPLYKFIVEKAIRKYVEGTLNEYIASIPMDSDYMKLTLSQD